MQDFIAQNPALIQVILGALIAIAVYLYKKNEAKSVKLISDKISELCRAIETLVAKDSSKEQWMTKLQAQIDSRDARCDERSKQISGIIKRQDFNIAKFDRELINNRQTDPPFVKTDYPSVRED